MQSSKLVSTLLAAHFKLSVVLSLKIKEEVEHMSHVAYASVVDSIICVMVCTTPDIGHVVSMVSRNVRISKQSIGK